MTIQEYIRVLEQRYGAEVYARIPFGENGTWGVNVQFHRLKDGAFLAAQSRKDFVFTPEDLDQFNENGGVIRRGLSNGDGNQ